MDHTEITKVSLEPRRLETRVAHTGGEWGITEDGKYPILIASNKTTWKGQPFTLIAMMPSGKMLKSGPLGFGESIANARVMAAAPALLKALQRFMELGTMNDQEAIDSARSAIAKATNQ